MAAISVTKGQILNYAYTGSKSTVTLPKGTYKFEVWGAQGGYRSSSTYGGKGGYSVGTIVLTADTVLYIYPGGAGNTVTTATSSIYPGGFNGGGYRYGYKGGGGGSDIRIGTDSLYARVIVAGGGGSDGATAKTGLYGGGTSGGAASESYGSYGYGGTQTGHTTTVTMPSAQPTANSSSNYPGGFGFGGFGIYRSSGYGGAGGGGWYGGCGSYPDSSGDDDRGGGGGSGYIYTRDTAANYPSGSLLNSAYYLTDAATYAGNTSFTDPDGTTVTGHTGDGYCRITVVEVPVSAPSGLSYSIKADTITLSWRASSDIVDGYHVYSGTTLLVSTTSLKYTYATSPEVSYTFKVTAYIGSSESDAISQYILYNWPPTVTNLEGSVIDGTAYLTWDDAYNSSVARAGEPTATVIGNVSQTFERYDVSLDGTTVGSVTEPAATIDNFSPGVDHEIEVTTVTDVSSSVPATLSLRYDKPNPPTDLVVSVKGGIAYLSWTPLDYESIIGYNVYVDNTLIETTAFDSVSVYVGSGVTHSISVTSLTDAAESDKATVDVCYDLPVPPTSITAELVDHEIQLSWNESESDGVVGYRIYLGEVLLGTTPYIPRFSFPFSNESLIDKLLVMSDIYGLRSFLHPATARKTYTFGISAYSEKGEGNRANITVYVDSTVTFDNIQITPNPANTNSQVDIAIQVEEKMTLTIVE